MAQRKNANGATTQVSVVIPTYNSAPWLSSTLKALEESLKQTSWEAEVVIVDDGSTDNSLDVLKDISQNYGYPINVISQNNQGRFMARWVGANAAAFPNMLLLDSRILMGKTSLKHIENVGVESSKNIPRAWNGHSITDPQANLVGHFWEVPTYVFWGSYLAHPTPTVINVENFNRVPKGTTFFMCPTSLFIEASAANWPEENASLTNDDTKIIRHIVTSAEVLIDPGFWAVYRPRTNTKAFIKHTYARGTTFVDGFAGLSSAINAGILFAATAPLLLLGLLLWLIASNQLVLLAAALVVGLIAVAIPAVIAAVHRCPQKGLRSYFAYALIFAIPYWAGIVRGIRLHGRDLFHTRRKLKQAS